MNYNPSPRERHMISIGLTSMKMMLEKELAEIGDSPSPAADAAIRGYLEDRIDHYRVLAAHYAADEAEKP
jgi:hypothetical protein